MKKLGLVGGMGPESTIPCYRGIVHGVQKRVGRPFFPRLAIESVDVFEVLRLCGEENYGELTDYLLDAITSLARGGFRGSERKHAPYCLRPAAGEIAGSAGRHCGDGPG